jgi:hypothetical protein
MRPVHIAWEARLRMRGWVAGEKRIVVDKRSRFFSVALRAHLRMTRKGALLASE